MHLLQQLAFIPPCSFRTQLRPLSSNVGLKTTTRLMVARTSHVPSGQPMITIQRRPVANYEPSIWDYDRIQSLASAYVEETHKKRADWLIGEVKVMIDQVMDHVHQLELIDVLERLGISYHFEKEINKILMNIHNNVDSDSNSSCRDRDLYVVALEFRLLRKHGYDVPQGVFSSFMDESSGDFKTCLGNDLKGILSLYEASYLLVEGESMLEKARDFATRHLEDYVSNYYERDEEEDEGRELSLSNIRHALEFPQHWRPQRVESRWFIDAYDKRGDKNRVLLELAKLDFNIVQAVHQEDLKHMSRWWNNIGLAQKYSSFSRDRLMECFLWGSTFLPEPQFQQFRRMTTKMFALTTTVDDIYDNYGTMEELKLFTDAIERWDVSAIEQLPDYMKLCFMALFNNANNLAQEVMKKQEVDIIYYLKKPMVDLCKAYLLEAEWYASGYTPTVEEYTENSWITATGPIILVYAYFSVTNPVTEEVLKALENYHQVIRYPALILRLEDDIDDDHSSEDDIPKSVQCYMHETGASLEDARKHMKDVVSTTWTKLNKAAAGSCPFPREYVRAALNLARMAQQMYQDGDGHASQNQASKDRIMSLLIDPIPEPF